MSKILYIKMFIHGRERARETETERDREREFLEMPAFITELSLLRS